MKILALIIKNSDSEVIRKISFNKNDLFYVFGNVKEPKNKKKTSNSIGKTLLLKMCDYIMGCKCDSEILSTIIADYELNAKIEYNNVEHIVSRRLNQKDILLDNAIITIDEYCKKFNIERKYVSHQIQLNAKGSLLGFNKNPVQDDYVILMKLLNMDELSRLVDDYYNLRSKIETVEKTKEELLKLNNINDESLNQELYLTKKKLSEVQKEIDKNNESIKNLELANNNVEMQEKYECVNNELKKIQIEISKLTNEKISLNKFISETSNNDISLNNVNKIYERAKIEVPELILRRIEEVKKFHQIVIDDRIMNIKNRLFEIETLLNKYSDDKNQYIYELDAIGKILSSDKVYQTAINNLSENNKMISDIKYHQGQLEQINKITDELANAKNDIIDLHNVVKEKVKNNEALISEFREFVFTVVRKIYNDEVAAFFDISVGDYKKKTIPTHINLSIKGETGEGISEVKKNIIDILIFRYSSLSDLLILDSSCFNGIDPRQVAGLLKVIGEVCRDCNKQAIISINKYQIDRDYLNNINPNNSMELSEDNRLLKISF